MPFPSPKKVPKVRSVVTHLANKAVDQEYGDILYPDYTPKKTLLTSSEKNHQIHPNPKHAKT